MLCKLHFKMTLFCSASISTLFLVCCGLWFHFTCENIDQAGYTSFLKELGTLLVQLQSSNTISHEWLDQMQKDEHLSIILYDNGSPLYYERLHGSHAQKLSDLATLAYDEAAGKHQIDIFDGTPNQLLTHEEFLLHAEDGSRYYVSAGILYKGGGKLSFLILYSLAMQQRQIDRLRIIFLATLTGMVLAIWCFSYFFTGHMLRPLEKSRQRQNRFIASASHELRTPLAVMLSSLEAMQKTEDAGERRHFATQISNAGKRMQKLITEMLLLANADSHNLKLNLEDTSLDEMLLQIYETYELLAKQKGITLLLSLPTEDVSLCRCDPLRLGWAVGILLDNALSYTPYGGRVVLFLQRGLIIGVADNGIGIRDEDKDRIFERFYRAESSRTDKEHFGLGLCTAKELIKAHHGRIRVEDTERCLCSRHFFDGQKSGGSTFLIELPLHP